MHEDRRVRGNTRLCEIVIRPAVFECGLTGSKRQSIERIRTFVHENSEQLVKVTGPRNPLPVDRFEATLGFLRKKGEVTELIVPASQFQTAFPDYRKLVQSLRDEGFAKTETGKLTIKTPQNISRNGRVYCIAI